MRIDYTLTPDRMSQVITLVSSETRRRILRRGRLAAINVSATAALVLILASAIVLPADRLPGGEAIWNILPLAAVVSWLIVTLWLRGTLIHRMAAEILHHGGTYSVQFEGDELVIAAPHSITRLSAGGLTGVVEQGDMILLYLNPAHALPVPASALASEGDKAEFIRRARSLISTPAAGQDLGPSDSESIKAQFEEDASTRHRPRASHSGLSGWLGNLRAGLRLALLRPLAPDSIAAGSGQFVALGATVLAASLLRDWALVGSDGQFASYNLPAALLWIPSLLLAAWVLSRVLRHAQSFAVLAVALAALYFVSSWTSWAFQEALAPMLSAALTRRLSPLIDYLPVLWFTLAALVALKRIAPLALTHRPLAAIASLGILALTQWSLTALHLDRTLWQAAPDPEEARRFTRQTPANEETFYLQPTVLQRAIADLEPGRRGRADLYFVGFAGHAYQDVFMKEVNAVAKLMAERFGAGGRIVKLINNRATLTQAPIASVSSLRSALAAAATRMNPDEDILFLFMTSHGSRDHRFGLDFWPMQFAELTPEVLKRLLDGAGIRWRVVVVSACYSGGFLTPLADDHTIVISAAGPDRNSFGCSNEADWTYFGQAFFDHALRDSTSLTGAFESAKREVAAREAREGHEPSFPQIHAGPQMAAKWARYVSELATADPESPRQPEPAPDRRIGEALFTAELKTRYVAYCLEEMAQRNPDEMYRRQPALYGDLSPKSPHWPRLAALWDDYAQRLCRLSPLNETQGAVGAAFLHELDAPTADRFRRMMREPADRRFLVRLFAAVNASWITEEKRLAGRRLAVDEQYNADATAFWNSLPPARKQDLNR